MLYCQIPLHRLIDKSSSIGVIFVDEENTDEVRIIKELEQIHDELIEQDLKLVQIDDADYEEELGLKDLPTLVQFSNDIPNIYHGEESKDAVMEWLVKVGALKIGSWQDCHLNCQVSVSLSKPSEGSDG